MDWTYPVNKAQPAGLRWYAQLFTGVLAKPCSTTTTTQTSLGLGLTLFQFYGRGPPARACRAINRCPGKRRRRSGCSGP